MEKIIFFACLFFSSIGFSQTEKAMVQQAPLTNTQRFLIDYEVKGWNGVVQDTVQLNKINLNDYETSRKENDDTEINDPASQLIIILYSANKTTTNKNN